MDKDAYYFPHFSNARHDRKIKRMVKELGIEGYGIYFMLLEVLREQQDMRYPIGDIDLLADEFQTSEPKVRTVVCNYGLFDVDMEEMFFSPKLMVYMGPYTRHKEQRLYASMKAKEARERRKLEEKTDRRPTGLPTGDRPDYRPETKVKESKVKESKEKKNINRAERPTLEQVKEYIKEKNYSVDADKWFNHYTANGWKVGKNPMKDWRAAVRTWVPSNNSNIQSPKRQTAIQLPEDWSYPKRKQT